MAVPVLGIPGGFLRGGGQIVQVIHLEVFDVAPTVEAARGFAGLGAFECSRLTEEIRLGHGHEQMKGCAAGKRSIHAILLGRQLVVLRDVGPKGMAEVFQDEVGVMRVDQLQVVYSNDVVCWRGFLENWGSLGSGWIFLVC
jgi:hypothetical protein